MSKNKNNIEEEITLRVITLGNLGVGKTSIIKRFVNDVFDERVLPRIGLNFFNKEVILANNKKITLRITDTFELEKYRAVSRSYCKSADGVLFVFALNNNDSLNDLKEWIQFFNENNNNKNVVKSLVGNKCDLEKEIDENLINEFAIANNLKYFETSAKTNEFINNIFEDMAEIMYAKSNKKTKSIKLIDTRNRYHKRPCCNNNYY